MPTVLQFRRGTDSQNQAFTGLAGELTINLAQKTLHVHDGSTPGGNRLATKAELDASKAFDSAAFPAMFDSNLSLSTAISTIRGFISVNDSGGDGSLSYDSATGILTYAGPSATEVRSHFSAGGDLSYDSATGIFSFDVEDVYTKTNFDSDLGAALKGGTGITYDSNTDTVSLTNTGVSAATYGTALSIPVLTVNSTGQITAVTNTNITDASTLAKGIASFAAADFAVSSGEVTVKAGGIDNNQLANSSITINSSETALGGSITLNHDNLPGFEANEHIDHSSVEIIAGTGLTGGGDLTTSRTVNVVAGTGITVNANDIQTNDTQIVHDNLSGFVANEHIDHTTVSITAGSGLLGGGDISANRTISIGAGNGITVGPDTISINASQIDHDDLSGVDADRHIDHTSVVLTAGPGLTASSGGNIAANRSFAVGEGTGINVGTNDINVDVGTTANKIVQLDGNARLPAVDGSQLTNLTEYLDSALTTQLINTAYIQARQVLMDSGLITQLVDSNYVRIRQLGIDANTTGIALGDLGVATGSNIDGGSLNYNSGTGVFTYQPSLDLSSIVFTAGNGLTASSGGNLSANREFTVGAGTGINVNTNDVSVDVGTSANKIVQLDGNAKLPAIDGSQLTNLTEYLDSALVTQLVDSAYINLRSDASVDSASVISLIDSAYINARTNATTDSASVINLIDSDYVRARQNNFLDSSLTTQLISSTYIQANQKLIDSALTTQLINSTYIQTNQKLVDSALTTQLIDSAYIQLRQSTIDSIGQLSNVDLSTAPSTGQILKWDGSKFSPADDATTGGSGTDADTLDGQDGSYYLNYNNFTNTPNVLDSNLVKAISLDSSETVPLISATVDSAYVRLRQDKAYSSLTGAPNILDSATIESMIDSNVNAVIDAAPGALNTLNELAAAIGDDANFSTTITNQIAALPDSAEVNILINTALNNLDTHDSAAVVGQINATVDATFINALTIDADTLENQVGSYYLNYNNFINTPNVLDSDNVKAISLDSSETVPLITSTIDSAYIQLRQIDYLDSSLTTQLINSTYIQTNQKLLDSSLTSRLIDSAYITARAPAAGTDSAAILDMIDSAYIAARSVDSIDALSNVDLTGIQNNYILKWNASGGKFVAAVDATAGGGGTDADTLDGQDGTYYLNYNNFTNTPSLLDSALTTQLIDSAYVTARAGAGTDSAAVINLIDSAYVSARVSSIDSALTIQLIDSAYVVSRVPEASTSVKGKASFAAADFAVSSGAVTVKAGGIDNNQLANSEITINGSATALGGSVTLTHDGFSDFVANEHIDHSGVTITAGAGLTGGGDITSTRTIDVVGGTGITVNANDIQTNDGEIVHDNLSGFVANKHIDHSGVTITAGAGLTGGGDITSTRTLTVGAGTGVTVNANDVAIGQDVATTAKPTFAGMVLTSLIEGPNELIIDPAPIGDSDGGYAGNVTIRGGLNVLGTTTTISSQNVAIKNKKFILADSATTASEIDETGLQVAGSGFTVYARPTLLYRIPGTADSDRWVSNKEFKAPSFVGPTIDRIDLAIEQLPDSAQARGLISVTDAGGDGSLAYNSTTGVITYTGPSAAEVRAHFTAGEGIDISSGEISGEDATTSNKGIASFSSDHFGVSSGAVTLKADGVDATHIDFGTGSNQVSTDEVTEGSTNTYFTNARARGAISVTDAGGDGSLAYNNSSGVITYTGPSATEVRAHLVGGSGINYDSATGVIAADGIFSFVSVTDSATIGGNGTTGGVTIDDGKIEIRTGTSSPGYVDFYCEVNNAHRVRLKSPAHSAYSGNPDVILPTASGTLALTSQLGLDSALTTQFLKGAAQTFDGNGSTGGVTASDGLVSIKTGTGSVAAVDFYCEVNNAHRVRLKSPAHANYSGNPDIILPTSSGTLALTSQLGLDSALTTQLIDSSYVNARATGLIDSALTVQLIDSSYVQARQAAGSGFTVQDEGSSLSTLATTVNFVGSGVTASGTGATKTITVVSSVDSALTSQLIDSAYVQARQAAGAGFTVQDEGSTLSTLATTVNFVGSGVTASGTGATKTITINAASDAGGSAAPLTETEIVATANQTTFPVNYAAGNVAVFLNGSKLADSDFTASNGTSVVLTAGATVGDIVTVQEHGNPTVSAYAASNFTKGTSSEISGNVLTSNYVVGKEAVYVNGVKQISGTDYNTNAGGTTITFLNNISDSDDIEIVNHGTISTALGTAAAYNTNTFIKGTSSEISGNVLTKGHTKDKEAVYLNGVKLLRTTDYTVNSAATTITFVSNLVDSDEIELVDHGKLAGGFDSDLSTDVQNLIDSAYVTARAPAAFTTGKAIAMSIVFG